jgi:hypothetical protein
MGEIVPSWPAADATSPERRRSTGRRPGRRPRRLKPGFSQALALDEVFDLHRGDAHR